MRNKSSDKPNKIRLYNPNRFNGLDAGICYLIVLLVFVVAPYFIKMAIGDFLKAVSEYDTFAYYVISTAISQFMIFFVAFIFCIVRRVNPFSGGGYKASWDGVHVLMAIMLTLGVMMTFYFTHLQFFDYTSILTGPSGEIEEHISVLSPLFMVVYLFEIAVLPAIIEEMMFRGIIMRGLEQFGGLFAVICSSIMFSLMHGNFGQLVLQFIGGLAIGGVVYITKNYLLGMIMHFTNNAFSVVYTLMITPIFEGPINQKIIAVTGSFSIVLGIVFCLVSGIYFISMLFEKEKNKALSKNVSNKYAKKRYYQMQEFGQEFLLPSDNIPYLSNKNDERRFVINGKYRRLNRQSKNGISFAFIGLSILLATVIIFFRYMRLIK